jgi:hypothetical protein
MKRSLDVPLLDAGVRVEPPHQPFVEGSVRDHVGERVGDLLLGVAVPGKDPSDRQDLHALPVPFGCARWCGRARVVVFV